MSPSTAFCRWDRLGPYGVTGDSPIAAANVDQAAGACQPSSAAKRGTRSRYAG